MCGFLQVFHKHTPIAKEDFVKALNTLEHRGPDAKGLLYKEYKTKSNTHVYAAFGHQRLSILDLNHRSNQPFTFDHFTLLYNGEIYNYKHIAQQQHIALTTSSDTEVVMKRLSQNPEAVTEFNGMWSLSLMDEKQERCLLSRDRYGKKPLFYYHDHDVFCVASSIAALKSYLNISLEFEENDLKNYILFGTMYPSSTEKTHFKTIHQVLPGHNAYFDLNTWQMRQKPYFDWFSPAVSYKELSLQTVLENSVKERLISDRPIALLLSGGIDSSLILSILYSLKQHENVTVFMGETGRSEDYKYAKKSADALGIKAETIVCDYNKDAFNRFLNVCKHQEKPFPFTGSALAMPQMFENISEHNIPVVLDGTGGDELFGGYWQRHLPSAFRDVRMDGNESWINTLLSENSSNAYLKKLWHDSIDPESYNQFKKALRINTYNTLNPLIRIPTKESLFALTPDPVESSLHCDFNKTLCLDGAPGGRLGDWVWHNDRNSMMFSIEGRSPFLDYRLHPFIFSGYDKKFQGVWSKHELRKIFDVFTPLPTQWRVEKQGFRWDGKHFFKQNHDEIIDLLSQSEILKEVIDLKKLLFIAKKYPKILRSSLGKRSTCLAGIEKMVMR